MLLKQCTTAFLLLGALVSAIPHNGEADDIDCSWKTCDQTCKAFGKRDDLLDLALRGVLDADDNDPEGLTYNVTASDELAPPGEGLRLSKRAGNLFQLPAGKSVDELFADALKKPENHFLLGLTNAELPVDTDPPMTSGGTRGSHYDLANKEITMIMPGLFGCIAVVIVNHESAWMMRLAINMNVAGGKLGLFFDNKADNKKAQFALWAGRMRDENNQKTLEAEEITKPIFKLEWEPLEQQSN
ncbi:hypothetical protein K4K52_003950 [Colletotrichum sp. SAR 10_76]|nr:hypothetical protein K4K51_002830 [Colletotrichum sp. SAR 10_75]KAI8205722.1 hypothetical protein K4K52_003950 [Colletotrichum sp. SAR 10_76]